MLTPNSFHELYRGEYEEEAAVELIRRKAARLKLLFKLKSELGRLPSHPAVTQLIADANELLLKWGASRG